MEFEIRFIFPENKPYNFAHEKKMEWMNLTEVQQKKLTRLGQLLQKIRLENHEIHEIYSISEECDRLGISINCVPNKLLEVEQ